MSEQHFPNPSKRRESMEAKHLPPLKHLPLRKRLAMEVNNTIKAPIITLQQSPKEQDEYPPTPGSQHSASSGSSDSTIPIVHSPPPSEEIKPLKKQPLKKAYHWVAAAATKGKMSTQKGVLLGNPLLLNNGNTEKNAPWSSAEDTIDSFKSAWLGSDNEEEDDYEPVVKQEPHNTFLIKKSNSNTQKRGRPVTKRSLSNEIPVDQTPAITKVRKNSYRSTTDGKLYCVCRQPYDVMRFMIACDRCDDWFHGECIGINEKESEFIDLYFCTKCSKITAKKTSWKPKCANPACHKAARIGSNLGYLSKYCADSCGLQVARARLELVEIKRRQFHSDSMSVAQLALIKQRQLRTRSFADKQDKQRLIQLRDQKRRIRTSVEAIDRKRALLQQIIAQIKEDEDEGDNMGHAHIEQDSEREYNGPCRFDSRLILPNTHWRQANMEQNFDICQLEKCVKHQQWQKIISAEFDQERREQFQLLNNLEKERKQIKARMKKRRSEKDMIKDLVNGTIAV